MDVGSEGKRGIRSNLLVSACALGRQQYHFLNWGRMDLNKQGAMGLLGRYITSSVLIMLSCRHVLVFQEQMPSRRWIHKTERNDRK